MSSREHWLIPHEDFVQLLGWLDPDRKRAEEKFAQIRRALVKIFVWNGCADAETLADQTVERVARRVQDVAGHYSGEPAIYFHAVARNVLLEYRGHKDAVSIPGDKFVQEADAGPAEDAEVMHGCLERCLKTLTPQERDLFLEYYKKEVPEKMEERRRATSARLGLSVTALRVKMHRLRKSVGTCIERCVEEKVVGS